MASRVIDVKSLIICEDDDECKCCDKLESINDEECVNIARILDEIVNRIFPKERQYLRSRRSKIVNVCVCRVDKPQGYSSIPPCSVRLSRGAFDIFIVVNPSEKRQCICVDCKMRAEGLRRIIEKFRKR